MNLALSLFLVYLGGKLATIILHSFQFEPATLFVLLWQDALIAIALAGISKLSKKAAWLIYIVAIGHFAISMPFFRIMATPLTLPLLRAGGSTLSDSIHHHFDFINVALISLTVLAGAACPFLLRKMFVRKSAMLFAGGIFAATGFSLTCSSNLQGLHRNSLVALIQSCRNEPVRIGFRAHGPQVASDLHGSLSGFNVILVGLESTGANHLSAYGAAKDPTPFLSTLAAEGVVFENAYAAYPESIKGLFALLFSRGPQFGFDPESRLTDPHESLPRILSNSSYETALFHSGRFMYLGMDAVVSTAGFDHAFDAGAIGGNVQSSFGVDDFATVDFLLNWVDSRERSHPFFLHYLPVSGHHPYEAPISGAFAGHDDPSRYLNALNYSDVALRRLFDGLQARGLASKTLFVIYGDHGEAFDEHPGNFGHTLYLYEENVRVPLVFWMPSKLPSARVARVTSLIDIAPTICDLLGLAVPAPFEGMTAFAPVDRPALFLTDYSMHLSGIRSGEWKCIWEQETGYTRLYNLSKDVHERINLAGDHPRIARDLRREYLEWSGAVLPPKLRANLQPVAHR